jgi:DDE superfamily endonuclease/helix-turn-helix, Psq domain
VLCFRMVRAYKRKLGSRHYGDYSQEKLEECLQSIRNGTLTQRKAALHYNIPRRTINYKLKGIHLKLPGKQPVFCREEEETFVSYIEALSDYGFPLTNQDLIFVITSYLNKIDRSIKQFTNNVPGKDWIKSFLLRYPRLKERFASNIKRSRAAVDERTVREYITNLKDVVKDVPVENIWNLDETNLSDDPGKRRVICRRGTKYPEKVCNFSKSSTSVMMCGNAAGELLAPFVVYKSTQLWNTWMEGGPRHCRYQSTKSGWFDGVAFNEWFESLMLPRLKKLEGKKVIIADNLSTHLNVSIFKKCKDNDIHFICLPPNSTHLTQPLDVAFFHPMKMAWRKTLIDWKATPEGMSWSVLPKQHFPTLLKKVLDTLQPNIKKNLESGFKKCGIYPCDEQPLLDRIAHKQVEPSAICSAFLDALQSTRDACSVKPKLTRKKKISLPAGKSLSHDEMMLNGSNGDENPTEQQPAQDSSQPGSSGTKTKKAKQTKTKSNLNSDDEESDDSSEPVLLESSDYDWETEMESMNEKEEIPFCAKVKPIIKQIDTYVVVQYEKNYYPGVIEDLDEEGAYVSAMTKSLKNWKWPIIKDLIFYKWDKIIGSINPPKMLNKRGFFTVEELL